MNINTLTVKAALTQFTGKKLKAIDEKTYNAMANRAPAIIQDAMYTEGVDAIVTRAYGGGEECYKVSVYGLENKFFKV